jgi:hypothetical protein
MEKEHWDGHELNLGGSTIGREGEGRERERERYITVI